MFNKHDDFLNGLLTAAAKQESPRVQQVYNISSEAVAIGGNVHQETHDYRNARLDQRTQNVSGTIVEGNYSQDVVRGDKVAEGSISVRDSVVKGGLSAAGGGKRGEGTRPNACKCGQAVEATWKVCPACATRLDTRCQECGTELQDAWKVCPNCGTKR